MPGLLVTDVHPLPDSLVSGPLAQTSAFLSKVSTAPKSAGQNYQHVICVYLPNVFDEDEVKKVPYVSFELQSILNHPGYR